MERVKKGVISEFFRRVKLVANDLGLKFEYILDERGNFGSFRIEFKDSTIKEK